MILTISEFWDHYKKLHVPAGTPENLVTDLKSVFFAGAGCALEIQKSVSKIKDKDFFQRTFTNIVKEIESFQDKIQCTN